jgi:chromosome segregation ATPase
MMDLRGSIQKLKEAIFLKKGTGQDCKGEELALATLEEQDKNEEAERKALDQAFEENKKNIGDAEKKAGSLKEQLIKMTEDWQELALKLFQTEREGETLFEEKEALNKQRGTGDGRWHRFPLSLNLASQRVWWAEDELNPLSEDFRQTLILDNRDYYQKEKSGRKPKRLRPSKKEPKFSMEQAAAFIEHGIPMPKWMEQEYLKQASVQLKKEIAEIGKMTTADCSLK